MDALLTDGCSRMSYSALRSLSALGLKCAVADSSRTGMCQWSKYSQAEYLYAPPMTRPLDFIDDINWILKKTGAKFLLPGYDETEVLAKYRAKLPRDVILPVASYESISMGNNKARMAALADSLFVPIPRMVHYKSLDELEAKIGRKGGEFVVKLRRGNSAKAVFYPTDTEDAVRICSGLITDFELKPERYPIVQRKISGTKWTVSAVYFEGRELAFITQKMLREKPATGGTSTFRVSVRNEKLEDYARRILTGMKFHGIAMVEFKQNIEEDDFWFIELNPRLWGAISHAVASGVDTVQLLYIASTEGYEAARRLVRPYREGVTSRWLMGDMILAVSEIKNMRLLKGLKLLVPGGSDDYDELKGDDLGAFAGEFAYFFGKMVRNRTVKPIADKGAFG